MPDNTGAHFNRRTKNEHRNLGTPHSKWVMDLSSPYDFGDRNGFFRYLFGAIDKATGKAQLRRYIEETHISDIKVISFDRGGEFYDYFWLY